MTRGSLYVVDGIVMRVSRWWLVTRLDGAAGYQAGESLTDATHIVQGHRRAFKTRGAAAEAEPGPAWHLRGSTITVLLASVNHGCTAVEFTSSRGSVTEVRPLCIPITPTSLTAPASMRRPGPESLLRVPRPVLRRLPGGSCADALTASPRCSRSHRTRPAWADSFRGSDPLPARNAAADPVHRTMAEHPSVTSTRTCPPSGASSRVLAAPPVTTHIQQRSGG